MRVRCSRTSPSSWTRGCSRFAGCSERAARRTSRSSTSARCAPSSALRIGTCPAVSPESFGGAPEGVGDAAGERAVAGGEALAGDRGERGAYGGHLGAERERVEVGAELARSVAGQERELGT